MRARRLLTCIAIVLVTFGAVAVGTAQDVQHQADASAAQPSGDGTISGAASVGNGSTAAESVGGLPASETADATLGAARRFVVGVHAGIAVPFNELSLGPTVGLDVGYILPVAQNHLEIVFTPAYASHSRTLKDGSYEGEADLALLGFALALRARFLPLGQALNLYGWLGPELVLVRSLSNGSRATESFAQFSEESTELGVAGGLGGEYALGPGAFHLDVGIGWSALDHEITGDSSTAAVSIQAGYRLFL